MSTTRDILIRQAHAVLDWNRRNLKRDTRLTEADVLHCFSDHFIVEPNGRRYEADAASYLEFLNGMKSAMLGIEYEILHTVADDESVLFDMAVRIDRSDGQQEFFIAMLLMRFDAHGKVTLWKEIYLPQKH